MSSYLLSRRSCWPPKVEAKELPVAARYAVTPERAEELKAEWRRIMAEHLARQKP